MINISSKTRKTIIILIILAVLILIYLVFFPEFSGFEQETTEEEVERVTEKKDSNGDITTENKTDQELSDSYREDLMPILQNYRNSELSMDLLEEMHSSLLKLTVNEDNKEFHEKMVINISQLKTSLEQDDKVKQKLLTEKIDDLIESKLESN